MAFAKASNEEAAELAVSVGMEAVVVVIVDVVVVVCSW